MSDVFMSYKREDELRVARLVAALEAHGLTVWWDRGLPGGESWRANIEAALQAARCVVVVWSERSTGPAGDFVKDEAARAKGRGILVPVMIDKVPPPLGFGELQAVDLSGWRKSAQDPHLLDLVGAIRAKLEGRAAPLARGPLRNLRRRLAAGSLLSALALGAGAFATNTLNLQNQACAMPLAQPSLSDACGALGLGARPPRAERLAWAQLPPGDCSALREHLQRFPEGYYRASAAALIGARTLSATESWQPAEQTLPLFVGRDTAASATEAAARAEALARAGQKAARLCEPYAASGLFRNEGASASAQTWACAKLAGGVACGFEGLAHCSLAKRVRVEHERCGAP